MLFDRFPEPIAESYQESLVSQTQINRLLLVVVLFNLCALIGCHRGYYRRQADAEARRLIREKAVDPRWDWADGTIDLDPQSRMFNPFSADHPPIPPDDPASHQFMHRADGKEGYPHWHANGDTDFVENPDWRSFLPVNQQGQVVLTLDRAYQLALLHSPDLQEQRETLYLSALDVSLDRFGFDSQLFTGFNTFFTTQGRFRGSSGQSSSTLESQIGADGGGLNIERLGITGANFAVGLANTILFNFAGNDTQSATSLIDFSIIQPLLRGAGRDRIMESLTQSERTLLANVRQMERFRRGFYLEIAIGRNAGAGPNRNGNFLGTPGSASTNAGGFFGLLEQQQRIRNQEFNVRQLEAVLELFNEFFERDRLDAVQLKSFQSNVYRQQRTLLDLNTSYQSSLDEFKLTLGLPPELDVVIEDSFLDRFELISDQVSERLISIGDLREESGEALNRVDDLFDGLKTIDDIDTERFQWPTELAELVGQLAPYLEKAEKTLQQITTADRRLLESDFRNLESKRDDRLAYLRNLQAAIESGRIISNVDPNLFEAESIQDASELRAALSDPSSQESIVSRAAKVKSELKSIRSKVEAFSQTKNQLDKKAIYKFILNEFQEKIPGQLSEMNNMVLEISLLQALARSNSIQIADVEIESQQAIEVARCMRRDWMNARASLVDNWRNIEFVADQLEAQVDLVFEGDIGNNGDNPFKLRYETGQLRGGFRFDAPIVRMAERNDYREALIEFQQTRRQFYQFEDNVKSNLREIVRNLNRNKVLFELDRRTVQVEIENVEINRYELEQPVGPGATSSRLGATTAQNLTNAIIGLNNAQNSFIGSWVEFEVLRRSLDFDLGTMQLDPTGQWVDPGKIDAAIGHRAASLMGIELDCQFCRGAASPLAAGQPMDRGMLNSPEMPIQSPYELEPPPEQPPFESDPVIEPALPAEIERQIIPTSPRLNEPETGINRQYPDSTIPNLLFKQVRIQAPEQDSDLLSKPPTATQTTSVPPETADEIRSQPNPFATLVDALKPVDAQIAPFSALNRSPSGESSFTLNRPAPSVFFADQIGELISSPAMPRASTIGEVEDADDRTQSASLETAIDGPAPDALLQAVVSQEALAQEVAPKSAPAFILKATTGNIPPIREPKPAAKLSTGKPLGSTAAGNPSPRWQSENSTLGGVLSRFGTQTPAATRE